ncbi:MAG: M48 family metallopeptidase [Anaerolineae bacterium]|nr:M48 family metallopeptidase [Anaerolineae bacterium]
MPEIKLGHRTIHYTVRESARARRSSLQVDPERGLLVVLPMGVQGLIDLEALLRERQTWILKHLADREAAARQYTTGETLLFLGEVLHLEVMPTQTARRTTVARQGGVLRVRLNRSVHAAEQSQVVRSAIESWYRTQARQDLPPRAARWASQIDVSFQKVTIKSQRTRWGSCSSLGNLNFNWRLIQAPPGAVDYVVIHELCHLIELNHSPRFWSLVATHCPDYKTWMRWLQEHHYQLFL